MKTVHMIAYYKKNIHKNAALSFSFFFKLGRIFGNHFVELLVNKPLLNIAGM